MSQRKITEKDILKRNKVLAKEYQMAMSTCRLTSDYVIDESDTGHWWCRIHNAPGLAGEFTDGEYLIEMFANAEHPFKPPKFYARTPNGVYMSDPRSTAPNFDICLGVGDRHSDDYECGNKTMKGMIGFMNMIINGLVTWRTLGPGVGVASDVGSFMYHTEATQATAEQRITAHMRRAAAESRAYNRKHFPKIMQQFDELTFNKSLTALPHTGLSDAMQRHVRTAIHG